MKYLKLFALTILFVVVPLYAAIFVDLPYKDVSVVQNERGVTEFTAYEVYGKPGQPELPIYSCSVLLPPDADLNTVSLTVEGFKEELVPGEFVVQPALPPQSINGFAWPQDRNIINGKDVDVYLKNAIFPKENNELIDKGFGHVFKIVSAHVNLCRYNPVTKQLYKMTGGRFAVNYKTDVNYNRSMNSSIIVPVAQKTLIKKLVTNFNEFEAAYDADFNFTSANKMVVVTSNATKAGVTKLDAFVASKKKIGVDVQVITETQWGSGPTGIRTWLQNNYQTLGFHYVLLIGGSNSTSGDVPMMMMQGAANDPTDYAYSQLNGTPTSDKICEVSVGRIPVYSASYTTVDAILQKTITYQETKKADAAWRKTALFGGPGYNSGTNRACVPLNGAHVDFVFKTPPWKDYRMFGSRWAAPDSADEVLGSSGTETKYQARCISNPPGIFDWATHGATNWAQDVLYSTNTAPIGTGQGGHPFYNFCGSCSNATISSADNLTYSCLKNCGMGSIGGTDLTYYGDNYKTGGSDNAWAYHFAGFMIQDSMTIGDCMSGLRNMAPSYGWNNRVPYVLYGDPSVGIVTYGDSPTDIAKNSQKSILSTALTISHTATSMNFHFNPVANSKASLMIYNLAGNLISEISCSAGKNAISWNLGNKTGVRVGSGIYLVRLLQTALDGSQVVSSVKVAVK